MIMAAAAVGAWCWVHTADMSMVSTLHFDMTIDELYADFKDKLPADVREMHIFCAKSEEPFATAAYAVTLSTQRLRKSFEIVP